MKILNYFGLAILLMVRLTSHSQSLAPEVIGNAASHVVQPNVQLSWTVGEVIVETESNSQTILTQGFHQTQLVITAIDNSFPEEWNIEAFPNPVSDRLTVRWGAFEGAISLRFSNVLGQVVWQEKVEQQEATSLDASAWSQGTYLLEVYSLDGQHKKTFKIELIRH